MKLKIKKESLYNYAEPVSFSPHHVRIFPRVDLFVKVERVVFETAPGADVQYRQDLFDNLIAYCFYPKTGLELPFRLELDLEVKEKNPFHFLLESTGFKIPPEYRPDRAEILEKLAAGVAHDFNNLLTVIGGNLELVEGRVTDERTARLASATRSNSPRRAASERQSFVSLAGANRVAIRAASTPAPYAKRTSGFSASSSTSPRPALCRWLCGNLCTAARLAREIPRSETTAWTAPALVTPAARRSRRAGGSRRTFGSG